MPMRLITLISALSLDQIQGLSQLADGEWNLNPGLFVTVMCWLSVCCGACHIHDFVNPGWVGTNIIPIPKSCPGAWGSPTSSGEPSWVGGHRHYPRPEVLPRGLGLPISSGKPFCALSLAWLHGFPGGGTNSTVTFSGDHFSHWREKR